MYKGYLGQLTPLNHELQTSEPVLRFSEIASTPPIKIFIEVKKENFTSKIKPRQAGPYN
jgi:hypothetical protein